MRRNYQPKRSSKRWLAGAPDCVLAVYDKPGFMDRYTVLLGAPIWEEYMGREVPYLGLSEGGVAFSMFGECPSNNRDALGRKVKWADLSDDTKKHIVKRLSSDV